MSKNRRVRIVNKSSVGDPDKEERAMGKAILEHTKLIKLFMEFDKGLVKLADPYEQLREFFRDIQNGVPRDIAAKNRLKMTPDELEVFFEESPNAELIVRKFEAEIDRDRFGKVIKSKSDSLLLAYVKRRDSSWNPTQKSDITTNGQPMSGVVIVQVPDNGRDDSS